MVIIWYILIFLVLMFLIFFWRNRYSNKDSKTNNTRAKKEDFNPEFSSDSEDTQDKN